MREPRAFFPYIIRVLVLSLVCFGATSNKWLWPVRLLAYASCKSKRGGPIATVASIKFAMSATTETACGCGYYAGFFFNTGVFTRARVVAIDGFVMV